MNYYDLSYSFIAKLKSMGKGRRGTAMYSTTSSNAKNVTVRVVVGPKGSGTGALVGRGGGLRVVSFKVEDYVLAALDRLAKELGTSRSELIRLGIAVILAIFNDNGEARRLLEQLREQLKELEEKVNLIEEDVEWLKGLLHEHIGPI